MRTIVRTPMTDALATSMIIAAIRRETPLAAAATRYAPQMRGVLLRGIRSAQEQAGALDLEMAFGVTSVLYLIQPVLDEMAMTLSPTISDWTALRAAAGVRNTVNRVMGRTRNAGASIAAVKLRMVFDDVNPEAVAWVESQSAKLVVEITTKTRIAIRTIMTDALQDGLGPKDAARMLKKVIGLTERDARAVTKRRRELIADGMARTKAQEKAERYADKLLRRRAETIARTETIKASIEGQQQLWQQAIREGQLSGREKKVWITADPCPICAPMDGEKAKVADDFKIPGPPAHPNCRCSVGLVQ